MRRKLLAQPTRIAFPWSSWLLGVLALCAATLAGCGSDPSAPPLPPPLSNQSPRVVTLSQNVPPAMASPTPYSQKMDAPAPVHEVFRVEVSQFLEPLGTLGDDEEFWKHMDEQIVDVGTYDLLFKNGIRIGAAPMSELETVRKHMNADVDGKKFTVTGASAKQVALETKKDLVEQCIFYFNNANDAIGRSYDRCTNLMNLSFEPTPRKPGSVRVKLCPAVRSNRAKLEFSVLNEEREIQYSLSEMMYDLNIRVDVPPDSFLIMTPSSFAGKFKTSVGHAFLTRDGAAQPLEQVIVIIPQAINAEEPVPLVGSEKK